MPQSREPRRIRGSKTRPCASNYRIVPLVPALSPEARTESCESSRLLVKLLPTNQHPSCAGCPVSAIPCHHGPNELQSHTAKCWPHPRAWWRLQHPGSQGFGMAGTLGASCHFAPGPSQCPNPANRLITHINPKIPCRWALSQCPSPDSAKKIPCRWALSQCPSPDSEG